MIPGFSLNYHQTSLITSSAAFPTATIAQALKIKTVTEPSKPPMKISGTVISIAPNLDPVNISTSSMKALKSKKQAKEALPTEYPFVFAFVTFPTASSQSVMLLTNSSSADISTIPPALSAIGPNPDIERT